VGRVGNDLKIFRQGELGQAGYILVGGEDDWFYRTKEDSISWEELECTGAGVEKKSINLGRSS